MSTIKFYILFCLGILFTKAGFTQISGELKESSRPVVDSISFEMESNKAGQLVFDIVVDREGEVVECIWNRVASTVNSRKLSYMAKNRILTELKFSDDNAYPPYQYGKVTIHLIVPQE